MLLGGGCCLLGFVVVFFTVRETRLLTLEQVDLLYRNSNLRTARAYRQEIIDKDLHDQGAFLSEKELDKAEVTHAYN